MSEAGFYTSDSTRSLLGLATAMRRLKGFSKNTSNSTCVIFLPLSKCLRITRLSKSSTNLMMKEKSMEVPTDAADVLGALIKESIAALEYLPIHRRLLLRGTIIDAQDLLAEINGTERIDTQKAALGVVLEEAKRGGLK